jgi:cytochrome c553
MIGRGLRGMLLGLALLATAPAPAETATAPAVAGRCVACHGADGIGKAAQFPNLNGQKQAYLERQLHAFRNGERSDPWMSAMARPLTDGEIAAVSA